jgi:hypothetical protein
MNRKNIIYAGIAILFAACSSNENEELTSQVPLSIDATLSDATTRSEVVTSFTADSELGVYMGSYQNCLFTTSDGTTFNPATASGSASNAIYFDSETETVQAYYPYSAEASSAAGLTLDATSEEGLPDLLFAKGTGRLATGKAKLQFNHLLSRITFQLTLGDGFSGTNASVSTGGASTTALPYTLTLSGLVAKGSYQAPSDKVTISGEATAEDFSATGTFASATKGASSTSSLTVLPQTVSGDVTLTCQFGENGTAFTTTVPLTALESGNNYVFNAKISMDEFTVTTEGVKKWNTYDFSYQKYEANYTPYIGNIIDPTEVRRYDYAMDDGSFVTSTATLTDIQKLKCVGIVYWTIYEDDSQGFKTGEILTKDYPNCNHGLIMSLNNAVSELVKWQSSPESIYSSFQQTDYFTDADKALYKSIMITKTEAEKEPFAYFEGYAQTKLLKQYNEYCDANSKSGYKVIPITYLEDFANKYPAPKNSTGWYLPSPKESMLYGATDQAGMIWDLTSYKNKTYWENNNAQMTKLGRDDVRKVNSYYWNSYEFSSTQAWYTDMYSQSGDYTPSHFEYIGNSGICNKTDTRCVRFICAY